MASRLPAGARGDECAEGRVGVVRRCRLSTRTVAPRRVAGRCPGRPTRDTPSVPPSGASSDRRVVLWSNGRSDSCGRPVVDWIGARLPPRRPVPADGRPAPGHRPADRRPFARAPQPDAPGCHGLGQDVHDGQRHRPPQQADAGPGPQQDARRAALRGVPRVLPGQRGRVLRQLLRLLPARGLPAAVGHVHREGLVAERRDRPAAPRRDPRAVRAARRDHRRVVSAASMASARPSTTGRPS